jgi:HEAT repeat protein
MKRTVSLIAVASLALCICSCSGTRRVENPEVTNKTRELLKLARQYYIGRPQAAEIVKKLGPDAALSLCRILKEEDDFGRRFAAMMLSDMGAEAEPAIPILLDALKDKNIDVRKWAATALAEIGPTACRAVPQLAKAIEDETSGIGMEAGYALMKMGPKAKPALPALITLLKSTNSEARLAAAGVIAAIGPGATKATPTLLSCTADKENEVRLAVATALVTLGQNDESVVNALVNLLKDDNEQVRNAAEKGLKRVGLPAVNSLIQEFKANNKDTDVTVAAILVAIGEPAVPRLIEAMKDGNTNVRKMATLTLTQFQTLPRKTMSALLSVLDDPDVQTRRAAAVAVARAVGQDDAATVVPVLIRKLRENDQPVSMFCTIALGKLGQRAGDAVPVLKEVAAGTNEGLRKASTDALAKIAGTSDANR